MRPGPLRRMIGSLGLLGLVPICLLLLDGRLTVVQGAQRAVVWLLLVVVLGRLAGAYLASVASRFDPAQTPEARVMAELQARAEAARTGADEVTPDA